MYFQGHSAEVHCLCWDTNGEYLASVSQESIKVWSLASGNCIHELNSSGNMFHSCVFHPSYPSLMVIGGYQVYLYIWSCRVPLHFVPNCIVLISVYYNNLFSFLYYDHMNCSTVCTVTIFCWWPLESVSDRLWISLAQLHVCVCQYLLLMFVLHLRERVSVFRNTAPLFSKFSLETLVFYSGLRAMNMFCSIWHDF